MESPPDLEQAAKRLFISARIASSSSLIPARELVDRWRSSMPTDKFTAFVDQLVTQMAAHWEPLRSEPIWSEVSPSERAYIEMPLEENSVKEITNSYWRIESTRTLLWALGLIEMLPPCTAPASETTLKEPALTSYAMLLSGSSLRSNDALGNARLEAELWHWCGRSTLLKAGRSVIQKNLDQAIKEKSIQASTAALMRGFTELPRDRFGPVMSTAVERHRALNWLSGYVEGNLWDLTPTDT
jgi:hypothetical protein